jgi:DNA phosphorothioation-associated putative methyltransferase
MTILREKTAIKRSELSKPIKYAIRDGIISEKTNLFDYGCGKGDDIRLLKDRGICCAGWDPAHESHKKPAEADIVNLGFVLNVIDNLDERRQVLREAFALANKTLIVAVLLEMNLRKSASIVPHLDGVLTSKGTFQKFYRQSELRVFVLETLGIDSVSAGLGVVYIFKDEGHKQLFLATRVRKPRGSTSSKPLTLAEKYKPVKELLGQFVSSVEHLGRIPEEEEFFKAEELKNEFRTFKRAFRIIEHVFPNNQIANRSRDRINDLLVYLALSRFQGRPPYGALPRTLQNDFKAFFGGYSRACEDADQLLFLAGKPDEIDLACKESKIGKLLPTALYIHRSYLEYLSPILRIYVGCAQVLVGEVDDANIIKIHRHTGKVSYLKYEKFDQKAHPELGEAVTVFLKGLDIRNRDYSDSENPPILHRKETFLMEDYLNYEKFKLLSEKEEAEELLGEATKIGFQKQWEERLAERGYRIRGHQLIKLKLKEETY